MTAIRLMLGGLNQIARDRRFAECLAGFQPVQPFHQHEPVAIAPHQDRGFLPVLQDILASSWTVAGLSVARRFTGT